MPMRSIRESTAPVRVDPTSSASIRSLGSFASARYMRMPAKTPHTLTAINRASPKPIMTAPSSDVDPRQAADQYESHRVEGECDDHRPLAEWRARHAFQRAVLDAVH